MKASRPRTYVIVHGAWGGAWAVSRLARRVRAFGHHVYTPTLTGLGEKASDDPTVNLSTHVSDVLHVLDAHDLRRVTLVGCSYGGFVITGAADKAADRISALVYVDAFVPRDGESLASITGRVYAKDMVAPPSSYTGKVTPQSTATFTEPIRLTGRFERVPTKVYVKALRWEGSLGPTVKRLRRDPAWRVVWFDCGHDIANEKPDELAGLLNDLPKTRQRPVRRLP